MTGLASRWATDETLVKQAIDQDSKLLQQHHNHNHHKKSGSDLEDSKWSKPITSKKSEALVSMWADAEDTLNLYPSPPLSRDSHGKHRNERRKSDSQHSHHKKRENVSPRKTKHNHDSTPRVRRDSPTHEDDEDNERGPMTAAAKAFAARFDKPTDKTAGNKHDHNRSTDGNSLAERLDKLNVSKQKKPNHRPHNTGSVKLETPRQDKSVVASEEDKQKEEKEKEELLKMLEELESQHLDWASME